MDFFGVFGKGTKDRLAPHELYRKGVEIYRRSGATEEVARLMRQAGEGGNGCPVSRPKAFGLGGVGCAVAA